MNGKSRQKVAPLLICLKLRWRRTVLPHNSKNLGNPLGPALRKSQFFQEFSDSAVPISPAYSSPSGQVLQTNGPIRSGKAVNRHHVSFDPHLDGFPNLVRPMIDRVYNSFLNRLKWEISNPISFRSLGVLHDALSEIIPSFQSR
jgi:hypothetical protein